MDNDKKLLLQKYIQLIRQGLSPAEPNYIALQNLIDDFVLTVLNDPLRTAWLNIQNNLDPPQYVSNVNFRNSFEDFLTNQVEPDLFRIPETDKSFPSTIDPDTLKALVEEKAIYLQKIAATENAWREKWKTRWREQLKVARLKALGIIQQDSEANAALSSQTESVKNQYIDLVTMAAQEVAKESSTETKQKVDLVTSRIEQSKLRELGLPPSLAGSKFSAFILSFVETSREELNELPPITAFETEEKLTAYSAGFAYTSAAIDLHPVISQDLSQSQITVDDKEKLVMILSEYHESLKKYGLSQTTQLQISLRSKITALNIANLPPNFLDKLFATTSPYEWLTQIEKRLRLPERLRPTGAFAPPSSFGEKIISFPQRMISGINFRFPSISFPSISFGGAGGAISSVGSAVGNNFLSSVFNLGGRTGSILSFGRGAAGAVGQKAVTFWGKYYLIIIGIIGFAFFTGFINLPLNSNIVYESDSAAFIVKNESSDKLIGPGEGVVPGGDTPIGSYTLPIGPVDILGCPTNSGVQITQPPYFDPYGTDCNMQQYPGKVYSHCKTNSWDLGTTNGSPVYNTVDGYVFSYNSSFTVGDHTCNSQEMIGFGNYVVIVRTEDGTPTGKPKDYLFFGHLQDLTPVVSNLSHKYGNSSATPLKTGEPLGRTDDTGCSGGPHLHYERRVASGFLRIPDKTQFVDLTACNYFYKN
ncbi:MAG: hypothetical protein UR98_C0027G0006 [Parcubacteria group bacterium GW2011_GWA1_36_12]|nr:MAG: hypothetical protein UR98_C0027G0006 [Parcubacteria group bacterium GW2011_GWA1_36_12]